PARLFAHVRASLVAHRPSLGDQALSIAARSFDFSAMSFENSLCFVAIGLRRENCILESVLTRFDSRGDRLERELLQNEPQQQEDSERPEHQAAARRQKSSRRFLSCCFLNQE